MSEPTPINKNSDNSSLWDGEKIAKQKGYSVENFYTMSVDKRGFKGTVHVSLPPELKGEMAKIIEQRWLPEYQTQADLARDAIFHRIRWLAERYDKTDVQAIIDRIGKEDAIDRAIAENERRDKAFERFKTGLGEAKKKNNKLGVKELIRLQLERLDDLYEPYKSRIVELIEDYKEWLKNG